MPSAVLVALAQLRRRRLAALLLALVVAGVGGVSVALLAGARRSSSVVDRYFDAGIPYHFQVYAPSLTRDDLLALDGVARADPSSYVGVIQVDEAGDALQGINGQAVAFDSIDPTFRRVAGTVPDGTDPFGVIVNEAFVDELGLTAGDDVDVRMFAHDQLEEISRGVFEPRGPRYTFHVAAVMRSPADVALDEVTVIDLSSAGANNQMLIPLSFYDAHRDEFLDFGAAFDVELDDGAELARLEATIEELVESGEEPALFGPPRFSERREALRAPVDLETNALLALGIGLALGGAVAVALLLRAEQRLHDRDAPTLRALGWTSRQLAIAGALRTAPVALAGAVLAAALAVALSPRTPIGIGRELELDAGLDVNVAVLGTGVLVVVATVVATGFVFGRSGLGVDSARARPALAGRWFARSGVPPELSVAAELAFERGRGARAVPARSAIAGGATAITVVVAITMLSGGIDRLHTVDDEHGWAWDAVVGNINFRLSPDTASRLPRDPRVEASTAAKYGTVSVDGTSIEVLAIDAAGTAPPIVVSGRLPASPTEVALGTRLLGRLGLDVGDTVALSVANSEFDVGGETRDLRARVVGTTLAPVLGEADFGDVGVVTLDALRAAGGDAVPQLVLVRLRDDPAATPAALKDDYTEEVITDVVPARVVNLHRVRHLPLLGTALAGALGTVVLAYTLATAARAQTRQLAVLRAIGLPSRRVRRVLGAEGAVLSSAMSVFGLPLGVLAGSVLWRTVADRLGVRDHITLTPWLLALLPASVAVAIAASVLPARRARRERVATLLRVE
jgi:ABC-type lipoprotein release transport system permease subunit